MRRIILIGTVMASIAFSASHNAEASENKDEPPSSETIEIVTLDTKLKSHNQVHEVGDPHRVNSLNKDTMRFIKKIAKQASDSGQENDVYASITIAQAILESASGTSGLAVRHNNLFGIKGSYNGNYAAVKTTEHTPDGEKFLVDAKFKSYPSWGAAIEDHDTLIRYGLNGYYSGAWKSNTSHYTEATAYLVGRYASDPNYASKLNKIIEEYNLTRFDRKLTDRDIKWLESDSLDPWELPIVPPKVEKVETWAKSYTEIPSKFKNVELTELELDVTETSANELYITHLTKLNLNNIHEEAIYTDNPKKGDVILLEVKNNEQEIVYKYGIVEDIVDNELLISEGHNVENEFKVMYRIIDLNERKNLKYINIEKNEELNKPVVELPHFIY